MHEGAYKFVARVVTQLEPRKQVLELGSRTVAGNWPYSGSIRPLFPGSEYVGVDIAHGENVDFLGDAATWRPEPFRQFDTVVCTETLEHTPEAERICHNALALLHVGGVFILTAAGVGRTPHSAVDGQGLRPGEYYRNVNREQLRQWLAPFGFAMIDTASTPGDIYALAVKLGPGT
ncbi:class I SAM-dependent methyltransferase [Pyxidicoccus trucidator]|uniref:class I SAM-dependent methyltransferase n=1 Tax=Pyxidicoccus trucidator TaxID=2709662 RepID=UPI0013DB063F|nr:methyltransferase domain-containing protein [Pyxidicoccus trucidator]